MNDPVTVINATVCFLLFIAAVFAILHPSVKDGVVIKVGLMFLAVGFGSLAFKLLGGIDSAELHGLLKTMLLVHIGAAISFCGYVLRVLKTGHKMQRVSDWTDIKIVPESRWHHVAGGDHDR